MPKGSLLWYLQSTNTNFRDDPRQGRKYSVYQQPTLIFDICQQEKLELYCVSEISNIPLDVLSKLFLCGMEDGGGNTAMCVNTQMSITNCLCPN